MDGAPLEEDFFGRIKRINKAGLSEVEHIRRFTLSNRNKLCVQVINYGATVTSIVVPDRDGNMRDVVLGFDTFEGYLDHRYYFGATIGRCANRISNGRFILDGKEYSVNCNGGLHHLHGGHNGFDKVLWDSHVEGSAVHFTYSSPSRDENYPGELMAHVTYQLTDGNELVMNYKATATSTTPINLTNHTYFNLAGHDSGSIYDHEVCIKAHRYTPVDEQLIPTGVLAPVECTLFDLRQTTHLGNAMKATPNNGFDINFCIDGNHYTERLAARLRHPNSGRTLEIFSTQMGMQLYTGNFLPEDNSLLGKKGSIYRKHSGVCLEMQNYPNAVNQPNFPKCVIRPGEVYQHRTVYRFFTS